MVICCHTTTTPDWTAYVTAFATVFLAVVTLFLLIPACVQIFDIRHAVKRYTFSIFLNQEDQLLNKKNEINLKIKERDKDKIPAGVIGTYDIETYNRLALRQEEIRAKILSYLYSLDGYSYLILKEHFSKGIFKRDNEEVEHYRVFINDAIAFLEEITPDFITPDIRNRYTYITQLQNNIVG